MTAPRRRKNNPIAALFAGIKSPSRCLIIKQQANLLRGFSNFSQFASLFEFFMICLSWESSLLPRNSGAPGRGREMEGLFQQRFPKAGGQLRRKDPCRFPLAVSRSHSSASSASEQSRRNPPAFVAAMRPRETTAAFPRALHSQTREKQKAPLPTFSAFPQRHLKGQRKKRPSIAPAAWRSGRVRRAPAQSP